jgi:hypothetical protein
LETLVLLFLHLGRSNISLLSDLGRLESRTSLGLRSLEVGIHPTGLLFGSELGRGVDRLLA